MADSIITVAVLPERITAQNANTVYEQLAGSSDVDIDCAGIVHCDSAGIAVFIAVKAARLAKQQTIHYHNPPKQLYDLARFLKVNRLLFEQQQ